MNIEELVKELDPVTIIEFKNYLIENLVDFCSTKYSNSKIISNHKDKNLVCDKCSCKLRKNGKTKLESKNIFVLIIVIIVLQHQIQ